MPTARPRPVSGMDYIADECELRGGLASGLPPESLMKPAVATQRRNSFDGRVLIVDDEPEIRSLLETLVEGLGLRARAGVQR